MLLRALILFIFITAASSSVSQILPFRGDLDKSHFELYQKTKEANTTDSKDALKFGFQLSEELKKSNAGTWARLNYAALLTEHDSVSKAKRILLDSVVLGINGAEDWVKQFHSLNYAAVLALDGEYVLAETLLREIVKNNSRSELELLATIKLAENLRFQGKLDLSRINWYEALQLSEQFSDSSYIAECHRGRGIVFFLQDRLEDATADVQLFKKYNSKIGNRKKESLAISLLGLIDYKNGEYESAIDKALEGYSIRKEINDVKGQGESLNNLALGYMGLKNWGQALRYLEEAVQLKTLASDLSQMTVILNNMGHCHQRSGKPAEAKRYFSLALEKGWENGQMGDVINSYKNLIRLQVKQKEFEEAVSLQERLINIKDSLAQIERSEAINELEVQFETDKKEQEITMLQQQQTIITNRWLTLALGLFLTIVIGALIFDNQKRKHKQEKELLTAEDDLQKAELKIMSDLLEHNQQKLSLYTENLLKKNELVGQLETRLKSAVESSGDIEPETSELLVNFSGVRILTDEDWEEFKQLFENRFSRHYY